VTGSCLKNVSAEIERAKGARSQPLRIVQG
jgi:hypothetical protein